jgi:hypothetical protein
MKRTQIQIHVEQWKWLKQQAIEEGISMAQLIRESIDFYHEHIVKGRHRSQKKEKALKAVGRFSSRDARADYEAGNLNSGA